MDWLDAIDQFIGRYSNVVKTLGAVIVIIGLFLTYRRTVSMEKQTQTGADRMQAETFTKAIDQLAHPEITVRLGGIYALERIAKTAPDYHWPIMETLTAFIRHHAAVPANKSDLERDKPGVYQTAVDVQAAITVLARRDISLETESQRLDLSKCFLPHLDLHVKGENNLARARFRYSVLWYANLHSANLNHCSFQYADLAHANLNKSNLRGSSFWRGSLFFAELEGADIREADFALADITGVDFKDALINDGTILELEHDHPQWERIRRENT